MLSPRNAAGVLSHVSLATASLTNSTAATAAGLLNDNANLPVNDIAAKIILSLLPGFLVNDHARTLHAILVATNLFWYQAIRQTVAILSVFICNEFADRGMEISQQAQLIAAPSVGNIFTQAIGGSLIQWLPGGTKTAITIALIGLATGCTLLPVSIRPTTVSSSPSTPLLRNAFVLLALQGFLFGPMFPSHSVLLSKWLPPNERGSAMAYGEIAMSIASMGVPLVVTSIAEYTTKQSAADSSNIVTGWRNGFYATGIACFGYLIIWVVLGRNEPESCSYISKKELDLINSIKRKSLDSVDRKSKTQINDKGSPASGMRILLHPSIVSLFTVHMIFNFVTLSVNSWMPTYYNDVLKLSPKEAKLHIVLPQVIALWIKLGVSRLAKTVQSYKKQLSSNASKDVSSSSGDDGDERLIILFSRRFMGYLGFVTTAVPLWFLPIVAPSSIDGTISHSPWWSTSLFSVALAGTGFHAESFRANYLDVTQEHVGLISGIGNCLSSLSALIAPFVVGNILQKTRGDWSPVWRLASVVSLIAAVVFGRFSTTIPVEEDLQ